MRKKRRPGRYVLPTFLALVLMMGMAYVLAPQTIDPARSADTTATLATEETTPAPVVPRATAAPAITLTPAPKPKKTRVPKPKITELPSLTPSEPPPEPPLELTVATFNVLGDSHTRPGGNKPGWASSANRTRWTVQLLNQHGVDVVGLQEIEKVQVNQFRNVAGGGWEIAPGSHAEAIAWRRSEWDLVQRRSIGVPYFRGKIRQMPVVQLRDTASGRLAWFATFHNPASVKRVGNQARWRASATQRQIGLANELRPSGDPVFIIGDMNEKESYFCKFTGATGMIAANGGSNNGSCNPPRPSKIDWIFGSREVQFSGYVADLSPLVRRTADHPFVVARALVPGS